MKQYKDTDYWVCENGDIFRNEKQLKPQMKKRKGKDRYFYLKLSQNNVKKSQYIHRMVAETYIPNPNNLPEIDHKDGDRFNNHISNLEWVEMRENRKRAFDAGLILRKLTPENVKWIKENFIKGSRQFGTRAMARKFDVHNSLICDIMNNIIWKEIV
jgi:hypothetical protein